MKSSSLSTLAIYPLPFKFRALSERLKRSTRTKLRCPSSFSFLTKQLPINPAAPVTNIIPYYFTFNQEQKCPQEEYFIFTANSLFYIFIVKNSLLFSHIRFHRRTSTNKISISFCIVHSAYRRPELIALTNIIQWVSSLRSGIRKIPFVCCHKI